MTDFLIKISTWFFAKRCGHFGKNSIILPFYSLRGINARNIFIGDGVSIGMFAWISTVESFNGKKYSPRIEIGDGTSIGRYCAILANKKITIEKNVLISFRVLITDHSHEYSNIGIPISMQGITDGKPVLIKEGVFIGSNCAVLPGVTIGKNSVIGANSAVTKDVPDYCVAAGNPAKIIRQYDENKNKWVAVK